MERKVWWLVVGPPAGQPERWLVVGGWSPRITHCYVLLQAKRGAAGRSSTPRVLSCLAQPV